MSAVNSAGLNNLVGLKFNSVRCLQTGILPSTYSVEEGFYFIETLYELDTSLRQRAVAGAKIKKLRKVFL